MHRTYASTTSPGQAHTPTCARRPKCTYAHKRTLYRTFETMFERSVEITGSNNSHTCVQYTCTHTNAHARRIRTFVGEIGRLVDVMILLSAIKRARSIIIFCTGRIQPILLNVLITTLPKYICSVNICVFFQRLVF